MFSGERLAEPRAFGDALACFELEVGARGPRGVALDEIVELIRADRKAAAR